MNESHSRSQTKWEGKYHAVLIPQGRRKAVDARRRAALGAVFRELAPQKERKSAEGHLRPDHGHLVSAIPPKSAVSQVVG